MRRIELLHVVPPEYLWLRSHFSTEFYRGIQNGDDLKKIIESELVNLSQETS